jgi:hypothetical protein
MHNSTADMHQAMLLPNYGCTFFARSLVVQEHQQAHLLKELHCIPNNSTLRVGKVVP